MALACGPENPFPRASNNLRSSPGLSMASPRVVWVELLLLPLTLSGQKSSIEAKRTFRNRYAFILACSPMASSSKFCCSKSMDLTNNARYTSSGSSTGDAEPSSSPIFSVTNGPHSSRTVSVGVSVPLSKIMVGILELRMRTKDPVWSLSNVLNVSTNRRNALWHFLGMRPPSFLCVYSLLSTSLTPTNKAHVVSLPYLSLRRGH
jgi:hypothetical protein